MRSLCVASGTGEASTPWLFLASLLVFPLPPQLGRSRGRKGGKKEDMTQAWDRSLRLLWLFFSSGLPRLGLWAGHAVRQGTDRTSVSSTVWGSSPASLLPGLSTRDRSRSRVPAEMAEEKRRRTSRGKEGTEIKRLQAPAVEEKGCRRRQGAETGPELAQGSCGQHRPPFREDPARGASLGFLPYPGS